MPIPFGARNNRGLFHKDKLTRKLPSHVATTQRFQELVIAVWHTPIKNKNAYRVAIVAEHGIYLLTPYKRLPPPFLYKDLVFPVKHGGRASFIKDPAAAPRSAHIILLRHGAKRPKHDATHIYTFKKDTLLLRQLQHAWIAYHMRVMNKLPVVIAINKPRRVERAFRQMSHQIRYSRKEERTEYMHMLADAGLQDRLVKHMFFDSELLEFCWLELRRATDPAERSERRLYSVRHLEYVKAILTLLYSMMFNSEAVDNRGEVLVPRPMALEDVVHTICRLGNPNTARRRKPEGDLGEDSGDEGSASALDKRRARASTTSFASTQTSNLDTPRSAREVAEPAGRRAGSGAGSAAGRAGAVPVRTA